MINKALILATSALVPFSTNVGLASLSKTENVKLEPEVENEDDTEACTVMYVGAKASKDGCPIIARSSDSSPRAMMLNVQVFDHNELANTTVHGINNFSWDMPSTTYRYFSTPRNKQMGKSLHWEASAVNEMGVGVSATLSCFTKPLVRMADPFTKDGIGEDNITQIIAATATSAKEGMQYLAHIIDTKGSQEANAILMVDQKEAWYMESYTGYQYIAIRLPDDRACTIGNEFNLDSLAKMFPNKTLVENEDYIASPRLFTFPKADETHGNFAVYDEGFEGQDMHLDLFHTYANDLADTSSSNHCHTRTWRGFNMFCHKTPGYNDYNPTTKYPAFFTPDEPLSIYSVKQFMRDRYEDISDPENPNCVQWFVDHKADLYYVANPNAYQIHIIKADPKLPRPLALEEWLCISSSNYAPFIPLSNSTVDFIDYYKHESTQFDYDDKSAMILFQTLNGLGDISRQHYGLPIQTVFEDYERVWDNQFHQIVDQIKDKDEAYIQDVITNFDKHIEQQAINLSTQLKEFLLLHMIEDHAHPSPYHPLVDLKEYSSFFGWDYNRDGRYVTLTHGEDKVIVDTKYDATHNGHIIIGDYTDPVEVSIKNDIVYLDYEKASMVFSWFYDIDNIDAKDFESKFDNNAWIIPVAVVTPIVAAGGAAGATIGIMKIRKPKVKAKK